MTTRKKLVVAGLILVLATAGTIYAIYYRNKGITAVQSGHALRQDLTHTVSANGEIKPKKSVNVSANTMGRIVHMPVKEGDSVRAGDLLLRLESIQSEADVRSAEAGLDAAQTELEGMSAQIRSNDAAISSSRADIVRSESDLNRTKQNLDRAELMAKEGLISREQYDQTKSQYEIAVATVNSAKARLAQVEAQAAQVLNQRDGTALRIAQQRSTVVRAKDQFSKTTITAPLAGVITYLPVNEGEIAIVGVQNQPGTVLMTIADLSVITAEVKVDETDIVNVRVGQVATVKVDALGNKLLKGRVSEVGNSALNKSGTSANATPGSTQEAKDFKVVITLDDPPTELHPGLSATVTINVETASKALTVPIQALTIREFDDGPGKKKIEKEGVFVIQNGVALFKPVKTGVTGTTDIEILNGVSEDDEVVTGPYQVLRTLQDDTKIKVEKAP